MKQYLLFFLFFISFCSINAQNTNWKQIDVPGRESFEIVYQSKSGTLFGNYLITKDAYISKDLGVNWIKIGVNLIDNSTIFKEDNLNNIYIIKNYYDILIFNNTTNTFDKFLTTSNSIEDYEFLDNGNFIVASTNNLVLYDNNKLKLKSLSWFTHSAKILINNVGDTSFVTNSLGASFYMVKFTNNLNYISSQYPMEYFYNYCLINEGRVFAKNKYTDNGINWNKINIIGIKDTFNLNLIKSYHNNLYLTDYKKLYVSKDNGNSFESQNLDPSLNIKWYNKEKVLIANKQICDENEYYYSNDEGINWIKISLPISLQNVSNFSAGINEALYLYYCSYGYYRNNGNWEKVIQKTNNFTYNNFISLKNNTTLGNSYVYGFGITYDYGKNWTEENNFFSYNNIFIEKKDILFNFGNYGLKYSSDFGKSWTDTYFNKSAILVDLTAFSKGNKVYYFDYINNQKLLIYDVEDSIVKNTQFVNTGNIIGLETSFNEEKVYVLTSENQSNTYKYFISKSSDLGNTFTKMEVENFTTTNYEKVKISTDHLGNIYVYNNKVIKISQDDGLTWQDITPTNSNLIYINKLLVSHDNYIYISTLGAGILKYEKQLATPKQLIVNTFNDLNKNCTLDAGEEAISNIKVIVDNNYTAVTDKKGFANYFIQAGNYDVSFEYNPDLYDFCKTSYSVNLGSNSDTLILNVPVQVKKYCADMKIGMSNSILRRCFSNVYVGNISNKGNVVSPQNKITINFDKDLDFENSSLTVLEQNDTSIVLNGGILEPGELKFFSVYFKVSCTAEIGKLHCISVGLKEDNQYCNKFTELYKECKANVGSYDPNDKTIFVNGKSDQQDFEKTDKIEYQIRFQNTGTDTAFHVRIEDPIVSAFNVNKIRPIVASHPFRWKIENRKLIVDFDNIMLVDSFKNEALSHGFIKFSIALDSSIAVGDIVQNQAFIYFDFNDAVITNNVVSTITTGSVSNSEITTLQLMMSPNPTENIIYLMNKDISAETVKVSIFNSIGKCIHNQKISESKSIDLSSYPSGIYLVSIKSKDKIYSGKVVKQ